MAVEPPLRYLLVPASYSKCTNVFFEYCPLLVGLFAPQDGAEAVPEVAAEHSAEDSDTPEPQRKALRKGWKQDEQHSHWGAAFDIELVRLSYHLRY